MYDRKRALLDLRTVDVTYRAAVRVAPRLGPGSQDWLGTTRRRADWYVDAIEARVLELGLPNAELRMQLRVVRESLRRADASARWLAGTGEQLEAESRDPRSLRN